ncbi:MAG TPA: tetratricopeptide repeat protein [Terriglobales bacterium]|jgi:tetratricopeptide (TPR) repeat protein|nr:tetratricopeptide repeat protein [Terriglobales bacterium]
MRVSVIFFLTVVLFLAVAAVCAPAEVIHLKNGRTIWADQVRENGSRVEYDVGDNSYAIPKSAVDSIEAGGVAPQYASSRGGGTGSKDVPAFAPSDNLRNEAGLAEKIIHDDKIDGDALSALEQQGDAAATTTGYFIAGKHEFDRGNFSKARSYFETALRFDSQNATVLNYYAALLVRTGNAAEALPYAERAVRSAPDSADALAVLGYAQFAADRNRDAIRTWKRSLELRPDATVQQYLAKAEREATAEADFSQNESSHFTLRYEGRQTPDSLRRALMETLESEYDDLVREFGVAPRSSIPVILYTDQAFFDVTQAPSWSGAVNDGKLRIPVEGVDSVTPELARVLKHELAHSFINQLSGGRCPQWLHEGIAQAMEPKSLASHGQRLAQLFQEQHEIPFNALEGSFMRFSPMEAVLAYDESLAAVEYINETYGMSDLRRILERLAEGSSTEAAMRRTIHSDYGQLETEVGKYLISRYGN